MSFLSVVFHSQVKVHRQFQLSKCPRYLKPPSVVTVCSSKMKKAANSVPQLTYKRRSDYKINIHKRS